MNDFDFVADPDYRHTDNNFTNSHRFMICGHQENLYESTELVVDQLNQHVPALQWNGKFLAGHLVTMYFSSLSELSVQMVRSKKVTIKLRTTESLNKIHLHMACSCVTTMLIEGRSRFIILWNRASSTRIDSSMTRSGSSRNELQGWGYSEMDIW